MKYQAILKRFQQFIINKILNNDLINSATSELDSYIKNFDSMHELMYTLNKDYMSIIKDFIGKTIEALVKNSSLDISQIVEGMINSFEVDFAEKIILDITQKELNAITWFGAIMGLLLLVLNAL